MLFQSREGCEPIAPSMDLDSINIVRGSKRKLGSREKAIQQNFDRVTIFSHAYPGLCT